MLSKVTLELRMLGQHTNGITEEARGGLTASAQQGGQDANSFEIAQHSFVDGIRHGA